MFMALGNKVPLNAMSNTVELQWFEHLWDYEIIVELMSVYHSTRTEDKVKISFRFSLT